MAQRPLPCSRAPGPATSVGGIPPHPPGMRTPLHRPGALAGAHIVGPAGQRRRQCAACVPATHGQDGAGEGAVHTGLR